MTNTTQPMTSREAFEKAMTKGYNRALKKSAVKIDEHGEYECDYMSAAWDGYQASEANQQAVISKLKRIIQSYETEVEVDDRLISEKDKQVAGLVEALDILTRVRSNSIEVNEWKVVALQVLAKVKGK